MFKPTFILALLLVLFVACASGTVENDDDDTGKGSGSIRGGAGAGGGATTTDATRLNANEFGCQRTLEANVSNPEEPDDCDANVCGTITFGCSESWEMNSLTEIHYNITGLTPGQKHALHVHQYTLGGETGEEDLTCTSTGGHWNPMAMNHGGNLNAQRHVGDLGNILADETGRAAGRLLALVRLKGETGIAGRSVVVHAGTDDLGTGGDDGSRAVGNAGARPACGDIVQL